MTPAEPDPPPIPAAELEAKLRAIDPAAELAYRWIYREVSRHSRRDPDWQARIR